MNADSPAELPESLRAEEDLRWTAFAEAAGEKKLPLNFKGPVLRAARRAFAVSDFIFQTCTRAPALLIDLVASNDLFIQYPPGLYDTKIEADLSNVTTVEGLTSILRRRRAREMVRIAFRDINREAGLDETMSDLSAFADGCLQKALEQLYAWQCDKLGTPFRADGQQQNLVVIGMGKLGARELNFSSDIDLIFAYPEKGETKGTRTT